MAKKQNTISTKLQFEGESEYKARVAEIGTSLYNLGKEMQLTTAHFADNAKSTEALTAKQGILQRQYEQQENKVQEMTKALAALNAQENINEKAVKKQEEALMDAKIALEKTGSQLRTVERDLSAAGEESIEFSKDLKENADQAEETSNKFAKMGQVLGSAGKAFGTALAAIGTAAVAAGTALAGLTVAAATNADDLLTQSTLLRQSTDDLQKYAYAARFIDVEMNTLTSSMTKNIKSMNDARNGSKTAADAYEKLGITLTNADGTLRNSNDVYWETIDALHNITNETERDALAMAVLGKSATDLNSVITAGSSAFKELGEEAEKMGAVIGEEQLAKLGAFDDKMQQLSASLDGLKNTAALVALPFLDTLAGEGTTILANFTKGIQACGSDITKMGDVIGNTLGNIVGLVLAKLPELVGMGVNIINAVIQGIAGNAGLIATAGVSIVETLVNALETTLPLLLKGAVTLVQGLAKGIAELLPTLIPTVVELILTLIQGIADNIPILIESAVMIINGLVTGILNALPILIKMLPTIIITIVNGLVKGLPMIFSSASKIITSLINGLIACIPELIASIPYLIVAIITGIGNGLPDIIASAGEIITSLITGLVNAIPQLVASIPQIIFAIVDAFASGAGNFFQIGVDIVKGLWEGIKSMFSTLWSNVKNFFGNLVDGVKDLLGIHSPSKVFAEMGENMAKGIGVGFSDKMQNVTDQIKNAIPTDFDTESEIAFVAAPIAIKTGNKGTIDELVASEGNVNYKPTERIFQVTQNIYTPQYNYAEQQRMAVQQLRQIARQV